MLHRSLLVVLCFLLVEFNSLCVGKENLSGKQKGEELFHRHLAAEWQEVLFDPCTKDWSEHWTLDGENARITHSQKGMDFYAGPEYRNDADHAVLWTRQSFRGDIRLDYEYTKPDDSIAAVTILYLLATGDGTKNYNKDISKWADLRKIPAMRKYFGHMNTLHISYAAFGMENDDPEADYIRARRYMPLRGQGLKETELKPDYFRTGLFKQGVPYQITVIKQGRDLFMRIRGDEREKLCHWKNVSLPPINEGRIGLRHMYTRGARYRNFRISIPAPAESSEKLDDVKAVQQRLVTELLLDDPQDSKTLELNATVQTYLSEMDLRGAWPDIDYTNKNQEMWEAAWHTKRLLEMARVYASSELPLSNSNLLLQKIRDGLTFWLAEETRARGWYHQQLFVPHKLGGVCLLLGEKVPRPQRDAVVKRLRQRSSFEGRKSLRTGSNLLTFARNNVLLGCLENSSKEIALAFHYAAQELKVTTQDGIQPDQSFHQHGPCLHMTTYGASYSINFARLAWLGRGTSFAFPEDKLAILFDFILDGQQWFVRGAEFDYLTAGRAMSRQHTVKQPGKFPQWRFMTEIPGPRHQERRDFLARMEGQQSPEDHGLENELEGNRCFWRSAMMVHRRKGYYASVRMLAQDLATTDKVNYENLFGHHLSDGAMCLMRSGNEYAGIYPLWNWRQIPGTTVEDGNPSLEWENLRTQGVRPFVGGVSDGQYGVAAMDLARGPLTGEQLRYHKSRRINASSVTLTARKAWFFFDREIVCLGAGITGKTGTAVMTTLNQCRQSGKVTTSEGQQLDTEGGSISGPAWVHHDRIGYLLPGPGTMRIESTKKTGSWERINQSRPGDTISESVFGCWLDHGKKPSEAKYVYHLLPDVDATEMAALSQRRDIEVLRNSNDLQAVWHKQLGITSAAFYAPGKLEGAGGTDLAVDSPCILLVREMPGKRLRIAFSKPDASGPNPEKVTVLVGGQKIVFSPPVGSEKGKPVVKEVRL